MASKKPPLSHTILNMPFVTVCIDGKRYNNSIANTRIMQMEFVRWVLETPFIEKNELLKVICKICKN